MDKGQDTLSLEEAVQYLGEFLEQIRKECPQGSEKHKEINSLLVEFFNISARGGKEIAKGAYLLDRAAPLSGEAHKKFQEVCSWISKNIPGADSVKKKFN